MYFALIALAVGLFTFLAWRNLNLALSLLIALLPAYLLRLHLGPLPTTLLELLTLSVSMVWLIKTRPTLASIKNAFNGITLPVVGLIVAATIGIIVAPDHLAAIGVWRAYFIEPLLVFAMVRTRFDGDDWKRTFTFLTVTTGVIALVAIGQWLTGLGIPAPWDVERRATSIFDFPNAVGLFVAPLVVAFAAQAWTHRDALRRRFIIAAILGLVAIVLAQTEAALVAIPAGLAVFALMTPTISTQTKKRLALGAVGLVLVALAVTPIREKLLLHDYSGLVRRSQWSETLTMLADRPLFGAGLSGYGSALPPYHDATLYEIFQYPHNIALNIWTELGLLGLASFCFLAIVLLRHAWRYRNNPNTLIAFAALATMTVHGLVDVPYFKNDLSMLTFFFVAMLFASSKTYAKL